MPWYSFTGSDPSLETDYTLVGGVPTCPGANSVCGLFANNGPGNFPIITVALKNEMILALNNRTDSTNVLLKT